MIELDETTVGGRVRQARVKKGLKQKELAKILQITSSYLGMIELNKRLPAKQVLRQIAENTDVTYDWLLKGEEPEPDITPEPIRLKDLNPQLFLSILLYESQDITKNMLATFLRITEDELDEILSGKPYNWNQKQEAMLIAFMHRIGNDNVSDDLTKIAEFYKQTFDKQTEKEETLHGQM